jgi:hypothetical protein
MEGTMANDVPAPPAHPQPPRGINHAVLNVRDLEVSHRFWTDNPVFDAPTARPVAGRP